MYYIKCLLIFFLNNMNAINVLSGVLSLACVLVGIFFLQNIASDIQMGFGAVLLFMGFFQLLNTAKK